MGVQELMQKPKKSHNNSPNLVDQMSGNDTTR